MVSIKSAKIILFATAITILSVLMAPTVSAYTEDIFRSLLKSRDALLDQRQQLIKSIDATKSQISALQSKVRTLEAYLYQTEKDLKDVETALKRR